MSLHHVELWVPDLAAAEASRGPEHHAAYLEDPHGYEAELVARV
jgi:hypothetical protein